MVYGDATLIDDTGKVVGKFAARADGLPARCCAARCIFPRRPPSVRADLWRKVGPLDLSLFFSFDYDLWVRLAKVSEIRYVPQAVGRFPACMQRAKACK